MTQEMKGIVLDPLTRMVRGVHLDPLTEKVRGVHLEPSQTPGDNDSSWLNPTEAQEGSEEFGPTPTETLGAGPDAPTPTEN